LVYQWRYNGIGLANSPGIEGVNTTNLILSDVLTNFAGDYALVVANTYGSITSRVATLTVVLPPSIAGLAANPDGSMTLQLGGSPGATYVLETKANLVSPDVWLAVATNVFDLTGLWHFTDRMATNFGERYYRLRYSQ
jgi:hypothetical protein